MTAHCRIAGRCAKLSQLALANHRVQARNALFRVPCNFRENVRGFASTYRCLERIETREKFEVDGLEKPYPAPISSLAQPFTKEATDVGRGFAFVFDCDGVLFAGSKEIPDAKPALRAVKRHGIRYLFLTNGGGVHDEAHKAASLMKQVRLAAPEQMFTRRVIQSHTPMRNWPDDVKKNDTVYITSRNPTMARKVAEQYGFKNVVTAADVLHSLPQVFPFEPLKDPAVDETRPFPRGAKTFKAADGRDYDEAELQRGSYLKIDHILVWNDPRDWSVDSQIITDLLLSHQGYIGTVSRKNGDNSLPNNGYQQDGQPPIWVSNLDLHWRTEYHVNRFGTGAFVEALKGVWSAASDGAAMQFNFMGKPSKLTYDYTHDRLLRYKQETLEPNVRAEETAGPGADPNEDELPDLPQLKRVYMVGDNPESDVRGALEYFPEDGTEWVPILVRTGVWKQTDVQREPKYTPAVIVDDVLDAVIWGMRREGVDVDREGLKKALGGS